MLESTNNTVFFDTMTMQLDKQLMEDPLYLAEPEKRDEHRRSIAISMSERNMRAVCQALIKHATEDMDGHGFPADLSMLMARMKTTFMRMIDTKVEEESEYSSSSIKESIDYIVNASEDELEMSQNSQTHDLWEETMNFFRQLQAFFEVTVTD